MENKINLLVNIEQIKKISFNNNESEFYLYFDSDYSYNIKVKISEAKNLDELWEMINKNSIKYLKVETLKTNKKELKKVMFCN